MIYCKYLYLDCSLNIKRLLYSMFIMKNKIDKYNIYYYEQLQRNIKL
uniref:Uncharacterized protein n=1 Tax=viral metagenome TaxID=1070528 RepID=A0A6C0ILE2_9ZZZZ